MQDETKYYVYRINNTEKLPKGQRSVLIKTFIATILEEYEYSKNDWQQEAVSHGHYGLIAHFKMNKNNHTTSDWNCIGIRVIPKI